MAVIRKFKGLKLKS